jgi:DNA-binding MarR family transcriptional regulator
VAGRARLTTGAVTGVLNRLEKAGYIRRTADPGDRRRVYVVMEETAQERVLEIYGPVYQRLASLFGDYGPDEIAVLADWFTRARVMFDAALHEIREGASTSPPTDGTPSHRG